MEICINCKHELGRPASDQEPFWCGIECKKAFFKTYYGWSTLTSQCLREIKKDIKLKFQRMKEQEELKKVMM